MTSPYTSVGPAGRYVMNSRIATGGMGEVWRAEDTMLHREVAVKLLKAEYSDDAMFRHRFESEARHAAALSHPGIAAVYDVGEANNPEGGAPRPYLVMELVDGQPLSNLMRPSAPMAPEAVRDLLAQVGDALGAAHRAGIVHRDVKPANLLVTPDRQIKVTDFGIARAIEAVALTQTGQVMGTPQYLSPEQAEGGRATAASDVYSLGVVAFECLAGRRPFEAESPVATALAHLRSPVPDLPDFVPTDLSLVVRRALSKKPEDRFVDGSAFAAALRDPATHAIALPAAVPPADATQATAVMAAATGPATQSFGTTTAADNNGPADKKRSGTTLAVLAVALAAAAIIAALVWWPSGDETDPPAETPSPTATPTDEVDEPEQVDVDPGDYEGRDINDVADELQALGLRVARNEVTNPGGNTPGQVTALNPVGTLETGDRITVSFWGAAPEPTETPTPTPPPTPTPTPTETTTPNQAPTPTPAPTTTPADDTPPPEGEELTPLAAGVKGLP